MTIKISDLKLEQLNFEEVKIGLKATSFVKPIYGTKDLPCLQLPWLTLSSFGVPPKGQYTKEDKQRMFIKVPIAEKSDLYAQLIALDLKMQYHIIMNATWTSSVRGTCTNTKRCFNTVRSMANHTSSLS